MLFTRYNHLIKIKQHLKKGGVIAYPTESCYGLGCDPKNHKAINKVIRIKGRSKTKGLIVIAGNLKQITPLTKTLSDKDTSKLKQYWPGFYSIILPVNHHLPSNLTGIHNKIAIRVTNHKQVQQISNHIKSALVSTSANKSGKQSIKYYKECIRHFGNKVLVINGNTMFQKKPSTIIDWETKTILR
ncbi:MAG: L-threonylcarbamoyladenylate synthase [Burkholderiales bacterium]|nr:L-threonylcarbamoyladenylate synthase [Burkholderiales bacterium]